MCLNATKYYRETQKHSSGLWMLLTSVVHSFCWYSIQHNGKLTKSIFFQYIVDCTLSSISLRLNANNWSIWNNKKAMNFKPIKSNPEKSFSSSLTMYILSWLVDSKRHATLAYGSYPAALKLHRCVLFKQAYNKESHDLSIYWWPQLWVSWSKSTNYILHTFLYLESIQVCLHYYYRSHCMWIKQTKKTFWFQLESWRSLYSGVHRARDYNFLIFQLIVTVPFLFNYLPDKLQDTLEFIHCNPVCAWHA